MQAPSSVIYHQPIHLSNYEDTSIQQLQSQSSSPVSLYEQQNSYQAKQVKHVKKKTVTRKLKMYGDYDDYEQKKIDEEKEHTYKYKRNFSFNRFLKARFFDAFESFIHFMKFVYDYLFCCKLICFILRTDADTQKRRLLERKNLINKAQMSQALSSPSSSSTYSTSIISDNTISNLDKMENSMNNFLNENPLLSFNYDQQLNMSTNSTLSYLKMYEEHPNNLVLDLDETLIHCNEKSLNDDSSIITVQFQNQQKNYYLHQRGYLQEFLEQCALNFNIYIYTASTRDYAEEVVKIIDPRSVIKKVYDRSSCFYDGKQYLKSLKTLGLDLNRTVMIDNNQACVSNNIENAFKIKDFFSDKNDRELQKFQNILNKMCKFTGNFKDFIQSYQS
ncbi:NLI interacting factor-like phosphatase (macronuclear) [Tetrahymena thermophila SB210]|uniref:Mitochondrial import inner membrane translocase subunit TIM50 n=1 Tax=Tetrahymena thermophila (strain SB210) TaxID=312017 RepID=Q23QU2_TETTS|nr:NLI interacting factor-like phosphatase [Tetrahymena thermophila SB210]EAR98796.2 NLI interacting factor-like phosphatase [Tetrahymena thermophila SB210]|eukprot:XP_001019041.2 NLI interacting factor-like phosphatase [Tetrahymena thermophila SB210]